MLYYLCKQVMHFMGRIGIQGEERGKKRNHCFSVYTEIQRQTLISLSCKSGGWYDFCYTDEKNDSSESIHFKFMHTDF